MPPHLAKVRHSPKWRSFAAAVSLECSSQVVADNAGKEKVMKNIVTKSGILVAAALATLATAVPAHAQSSLMRMDIPFSFLAGEQRMPAGVYWVRLEGNFHIVDLSPANQGTACRVGVKEGGELRKLSNADRGVLLFRKYGSTFVLKSVFAPGDTDRHDLRTSKTEIELASAAGMGTVGEGTESLQSR